MRRPAAAALGAALALAAALPFAGCGGDGSDASAGGRLVVSAAASLAEPLRACSREFDGAQVRLSFAGSDQLVAQVRRGLRPDLVLTADLDVARPLAQEGLAGEPVAFASNELVVAVRPDAAIRSVDDLARPGVTVGIAAASVPAGAYAREALSRLDERVGRAVLDRVRTEEPDVTGVVGKVLQGAVDAGFVYATDVAAAGDRLRAVRLPGRARPAVRYGVSLIRDGGAPTAAARRFAEDLGDGACADALRAAGFGPPGG